MLLFLIMYIMHVSVCGYVHTSASACKNLKRASGSLQLELQAVVWQPLWVLGTEARSSSRAVHTPYWATAPDLNEFLCFLARQKVSHFKSFECYTHFLVLARVLYPFYQHANKQAPHGPTMTMRDQAVFVTVTFLEWQTEMTLQLSARRNHLFLA